MKKKSTGSFELGRIVRQSFIYLLVSVRFLTVFPTFSAADRDTEHFKSSVYFFTVTGFGIGLVLAAGVSLLQLIFPAAVIAVTAAVLLSVVSGFLHLDGLADTFDGFMSSRPKEACLEIMKDSRVGVMGATAVCCTLLMKAAAIFSIADTELVAALIIAPAAGRTAITISMAYLPYARTQDGLGKLFYSESIRLAALVSTLLLVMICLFFEPGRILFVLLALTFVCGLLGIICSKRINGVTGDTLGAVCELTELGVLLSFTI